MQNNHKSSKVCKYYLNGNCKYQQGCFFMHPKKLNNDKLMNSNSLSFKPSSQTPASHSLSSSCFPSSSSSHSLPPTSSFHPPPSFPHSQIPDFIDFSLSELGKSILEQNQAIYEGKPFHVYISSLKSSFQKEIAQIQRKYLSSFLSSSLSSSFSLSPSSFHNFPSPSSLPDFLLFQIRHSPTIKQNQLNLPFLIEEGYLWLEFRINTLLYPNEGSVDLKLLNLSLPNWFKKELILEFQNIFKKNCRIFDSLRYLDNHFDLWVQNILKKWEEGGEEKEKEIQDEKKNGGGKKEEEEKEDIGEKKEEKKARIGRVRIGGVKGGGTGVGGRGMGKVIGGEVGVDLKVIREEVGNKGWSQREQTKLEEGMVKYKGVKEAKEKWSLIAKEIGRTTEECVERFKYCRERALKNLDIEIKSEKDEEEKNQTEGSEEENFEEDEEEEEEDEDEEIREDKEKEEVDEEQEENEYEVDTDTKEDQALERQYNLPLSTAVSVNEFFLSNISLCTFSSALFLVRCSLCKSETELTLHPSSSPSYLLNDLPCLNCSSAALLLLKKNYLTPFSSSLSNPSSSLPPSSSIPIPSSSLLPPSSSSSSFFIGFLAYAPWQVLDLLKSDLAVTCDGCNEELEVKGYTSNSRFSQECRKCFRKLGLTILSFSLTVLMQNSSTLTSKTENKNKQAQNPNLYPKKRPKQFKLGSSLPNNGVCKHYKHSYR